MLSAAAASPQAGRRMNVRRIDQTALSDSCAGFNALPGAFRRSHRWRNCGKAGSVGGSVAGLLNRKKRDEQTAGRRKVDREQAVEK
jgi:hypothetical protein